MTAERNIAKIFNLTDENWLKHANPWSVWTRYSILPCIVSSLWARLWIDWWCLIPLAISLLWTFYNPILFPKPKSTKNWASRAVFGEKIFMNRDKITLPEIHKSPIYKILNLLSGLGVLIAFISVYSYSFTGVLAGTALAYLGKSWYLDRMVWLYNDLKQNNEEYQNWEYE
ncbi:DUF6653 family protein [uncultured Bacteroides sp.]|uniref:DUF6653 family protein n=1 Tax=uncultured Bacteroides sp. TaxID=162156 RepID=UPI002AAB31FB|nr:DUF6653 family protein [uncultured Bacteroides sp.]